MQDTVILALGGNALISDAMHQTIDDQYNACKAACEHIAHLLKSGVKLIVTHGNGPQVGFISRRSELSRSELHPVPLNICVADTQGSIGVMLQRALHNLTVEWAPQPTVATIVTQVIVDNDDPAFANPAKPIGTYIDKATAEARTKEEGWNTVEIQGKGYRRVVPSPKPKTIVELKAIQALAATGCIVVAAGGGGIPVIRREDGTLGAVEAVVDKDHTSSLLATTIGAQKLVIATNVEKVMLRFNTPEAQELDTITLAEARQYVAEGHFDKGSMLPKVEAAMNFVEATGQEAIITSVHTILDAYKGLTGTHIVA